MSDSLLPEQEPNISRQRLEKMMQLMRDPFALAVLASLGIHGLVWAGLPLLPMAKPEDFNPKETVGVVELSPTEQLKLPDFANPSVGLPPVKKQTKASRDPFKPSLTIKTPPNPSLFDNSSLYNIPILPPPPPVPFLSLNDLPPIPNNQSPVIRVRPQIKHRSITLKTPSPPTIPAPPTEGASTPQLSPARSEKLTPEQLSALMADARQRLESRGQENRELFAYNKANTTEGEVRQNIGSFSKVALNLSQGNIENDQNSLNIQKTITDLYPKEACPSKLKGNAVVAVLVQPDGKLAMAPDGKEPLPPTVIQSSGYTFLNKFAVDTISKRTFEKGDKYRIMLFPFQFEPLDAVCNGAPEKPASEGKKPES
jgi:hypothetical protein